MAFDFRVTALEDKEFEEIVRTFADTTAANARGAAAGTTTNLLEPRLWMREVVDAAQKRFRYGEVSMTKDIPKGHVNLIVPKRRAFISGTSWAANVTPGTAVNFTTLNNFDGVEVNPNWRNYATAISYDVIQQNVVDYVGAAREELVYKAGDHVDQDIVTEISGATLASVSTVGAQAVFGGDATQASELATGDVITTDMVAEAMRKLQTDVVRYWTGGTGETAQAKTRALKNPWINENDFVLLIAPEQEEAFRTDSQFVNAAEYGARETILNGEIGNYLGTKVVVSVNTHYVANTGVGTVDGSAAGTDMNSAVLLKAQKATCLAYLKRPTLHVVDFPRELEVSLIMEQAYGANTIHDDAIVFLHVSQV